jgi:ankyrin repeat protein
MNTKLNLKKKFALMAFAISLPCQILSMQSRAGVGTLHRVVRAGDIASVKTLLTRENANAFHNGETALHIAADTGFLTALNLLLAAGADIDAGTQKDHWTALHIATVNEHENMIAQLLAAGAEVNTDAYVKQSNIPEERLQLIDADGNVNNEVYSMTPLQAAIINGNLSITKQLLAAKANMNARGGSANDTPLHIAADTVDGQLAHLLLENGAQENATNLYGWTPLHSAVESEDINTDNIDRLHEAISGN